MIVRNRWAKSWKNVNPPLIQPSAWLGHLGPLLHCAVIAAEMKFRKCHWWSCGCYGRSSYTVFLRFYLHLQCTLFFSLVSSFLPSLWSFSFSFPSSLLFQCVQDGVQYLPQWRKKLIFLVALKGVNIKEASQHVHATACWWLADCQSGWSKFVSLIVR